MNDFHNALPEGDRVEVWNVFSDQWTGNFEVAEATDGGYRLRRLSDREVLPVEFSPERVRSA
jgi:hypothetical protein